MSDADWIVIPNWQKFQHYKNRDPIWIKDYIDQLARKEYLDLTFAQRGLLLDIRRLYAQRRGMLTSDTFQLSSTLGRQVKHSQLEALNHAGLIRFRASRPIATRTKSAPPREKYLRTSPKRGQPASKKAADPLSEKTENDDPPIDPKRVARLKKIQADLLKQI